MNDGDGKSLYSDGDSYDDEGDRGHEGHHNNRNGGEEDKSSSRQNIKQ